MNYLKGVRFRESENYKTQMESMRLQAYWTARPHLKNQKLSPTDFMPLPWDKQPHTDQAPVPAAVGEHFWQKVDESQKR